MGTFNIPMFNTGKNPTGAGGNMFSLPNATGQQKINSPQIPGGGGGNPFAGITSGTAMPGMPAGTNYNPYSTNGGQQNSNLPFGFGSPSTNNPGSFLPGNFTSQWGDELGSGLSSMLNSYISSGAGFNPQALQAIFSSMQPQIARNLSTIDNSSGVSGTRFSSAHDFATSDYLSQVSAQQGQIAAQMYQHSNDIIAQLMSSLIDPTIKQRENMPGLMDQIAGGVQMGSDAAGGIAMLAMAGLI